MICRLLRILLISLGSTYCFVIVAVPELIISRLLQILTHLLEADRDELSKRRLTPAEFCKKTDILRNSFDSLGKV